MNPKRQPMSPLARLGALLARKATVEPAELWSELDRIYQSMSQQAERDRRKGILIARRGGKCLRCGEMSPPVLEFHHYDPSVKQIGLKKANLLRDWDAVLAEVDRCILLCRNCHAEVHAFRDYRFIKGEERWLSSENGTNTLH